MTRTDLRAFRQRRHAERFWRAADDAGKMSVSGSFGRLMPLSIICTSVAYSWLAHQHAAEQRFAVVADHDFLVDLLRAVRPLVAQRSRGAPVGVAERGHVHAEQLEFVLISAPVKVLSPPPARRRPRAPSDSRARPDRRFSLPQAHSPMASTSGSEVCQPSSMQIPAAFADSQPAAARQRVLRTDARRKDHMSVSSCSPSAKRSTSPPSAGGDLRRGLLV